MPGVEHEVDVLICGSGSAGLCAAIWLARAGVDFTILERTDGPLQLGKADGVQTRTVEIFESFGIERQLLDESYHVLEIAFWSSDGHGGIELSRYAPDLPPGLSHMPHVILNQSRINGLMIDALERSTPDGGSHIEYSQAVQDIEIDEDALGSPDAYCARVTSIKDSKKHVFRAKYVLAGDGAHSIIRKSLGYTMVGDSSNSVWGVMDVFVRTNFPDIRKKAILRSDYGSLMIIPREGDTLVRFYLEIDDADKQATMSYEKLVDKATHIFRPYKLEVVGTLWWSTYHIGQRLADNFSVSDRVFLMGDACHTHSPKAGQGMNVSLQDGYNIGWKLAAVLCGKAVRSILGTYIVERRRTAADLIAFDRQFTKLFSSAYRRANGISPADFETAFIEAGRYTAGQATKYTQSILTSTEVSDKVLALIVGDDSVLSRVGMRFPTAQVVRYSDARTVQLVRSMLADGRWHLVVYGGNICDAQCKDRLIKASETLKILVQRFTPAGADLDSVFNILLVLSSPRVLSGQYDIPQLFFPITGEWQIQNLHKVFFDDQSHDKGHGQAYKSYGIDPLGGVVIIVRPDHYIAKISTFDELSFVTNFFEAFMTEPRFSPS